MHQVVTKAKKFLFKTTTIRVKMITIRERLNSTLLEQKTGKFLSTRVS